MLHFYQFGFFAAFLVPYVLGHGLLTDPPARNHMGKAGFDVPVNWNEMGLNCGGFSNQWNNFDGKCGICGDPYQGPREHEPPTGKYATGIIGRCINSGSSIMTVTVRITAYHKGYFEFRLCPHNNPATPATEACLNQYLLKVEGTNGGTRYDINMVEQEYYTFDLELPQGVTCTHCVLQWLYNTGNSWGCNATGCAKGWGPQEQFINCADIAILPDCNNPETVAPPTGGPETTRRDGTSWKPPATTQGPPTTTETNDDNSEDSEDDDGDDEDDGNGPRNCVASGPWTGNDEMTAWCMLNCNHVPSHCPSSHCRCDN